MARLIHLNGPPAIGKSTLARRYGEEHPGTLVCDIDVLRAMVGGWEADFHGAGALIRTSALALITAYLRTDHDVVLPQLVSRADELARFRGAAEAAGADYVCVLLMAEPDTVVRRFHARAAAAGDDPWLLRVHALIDEQGGDNALLRGCGVLETLASDDPTIRILPSTDLVTTYDALVAALRSEGAGSTTPSRQTGSSLSSTPP